MSHGYADVQVVSATGEYDPAQEGFHHHLHDRGRVSTIISALSTFSPISAPSTRRSLRSVLRTRAGEIYNGDAVEKTVEEVTVEIARHGYPFATVRPRGDRNPQDRTISVVYVVDEGARAYIERINIRGNTRTRDYVIRREFDISEGDPYNRALIDRAERRIKNLELFQNGEDHQRAGLGAGSRRDQRRSSRNNRPATSRSWAAYSTADGFMAQVSIAERNLFGTGRYAKASVTYGQYIRGAELSFVEPYLLDQRISGGIDLFARQTLANTYLSYGTENDRQQSETRRSAARRSLVATAVFALLARRSTLPSSLNDCNNINPDFVNTFPTPNAITRGQRRIAGNRLMPPGYNCLSARIG